MCKLTILTIKICADASKFIRDHRPGIRLIARAVQRFLIIESQLRVEEERKRERERRLELQRISELKKDKKRVQKLENQAALFSSPKTSQQQPKQSNKVALSKYQKATRSEEDDEGSSDEDDGLGLLGQLVGGK